LFLYVRPEDRLPRKGGFLQRILKLGHNHFLSHFATAVQRYGPTVWSTNSGYTCPRRWRWRSRAPLPKMSVNINWTTRRHILEDCILNFLTCWLYDIHTRWGWGRICLNCYNSLAMLPLQRNGWFSYEVYIVESFN
jgi:hypothetical protein